MKILKEGEVKPKVQRKTCFNCKSILEFPNEDIQQDRDGSYIICPVCQTIIAAKHKQ